MTEIIYCYLIYDEQLEVFRNEKYKSYKEALKEFAEYWRGIALSDWHENFDFEFYKENHNISRELSIDEEYEIANKDIHEMSDEEIFDFFEFSICKSEYINYE